MDGIRDTPAPHELHRTRIDRGGSRVVGNTVTLFDEQTRQAARAEIDRERKPDRATAHD
jgi:hypothetical protein